MASRSVDSQVSGSKNLVSGVRSYKEIVEFLDSRKSIDYSESAVQRMKQLDEAFGGVSKDLDIIVVGGYNGKSSVINFSSKLLNEEGIKVGTAYSSHFLTYTERISIDQVYINKKSFTESANEVVDVAETCRLDMTSFEISLMSALIYFKKEKVDVAILEVGIGGRLDATTAFNRKIAVITRTAEDGVDIIGDRCIPELMGVAKKDSYFISSEQSKIKLQEMKVIAEEREAKWIMPIRKLAPLPYIYEQLYGKSASLSERIAQIYVEDIKNKFSSFLRGNILATERGQRGRPTLEAKRESELHPVKTLKKFWNDEGKLLRGCFELLKKEKPTTLLDNAHNTDAIENLFLGIRLIHYEKAINGLTIILGVRDYIKSSEIIKQVRYLFKRIQGEIIFVPLKGYNKYLDPEKLVEEAKAIGINARSYKSFVMAIEQAEKTVDSHNGLICIAGHPTLISEYWKYKGIKKIY